MNLRYDLAEGEIDKTMPKKMHGDGHPTEVAEKISQGGLVLGMDVLGSIKAELATTRSKLKV